MATGLIDIMKRAALDATDNAQMCDLRYGTVVSTSPLKVQVTNVLTIPTSMLVVPRHLTDYEVNVSLDWTTESRSGGVGEDSFSSHSHSIVSKKTKVMTIHNALKVGDKVALLRKQGGQSYFILDRI